MSLAGLILLDVKLRAPKDNAAARVEEVEEKGEVGRDATVGEPGCAFLEGAFLDGCRLSCRAFANAFS